MKTLLINQDQVKQLISPAEVVDAVEKTYRGIAEGTVINPSTLNLDLGQKCEYPPYQGFMNAMPAYVGWADVAGLKWVGGFLGERKKQNLPFITSMIMMINPKLGTFTSVMDGGHITNMRTGAQTAVALQYILPAEKKSIRIGLYGAGMQGTTQIIGIAQRFDIEEVVVYDINPDAAKTYPARVQDYVKGKVTIASTPRQAATGDAIIMITPARESYLENAWVEPGTVVLPLSSYPECKEDLMLSCEKIIVDHIEQTLDRGALAKLASRGKISEKDIYATISQLVVGKKAARIMPHERFLCVALGMGCMDVAVAGVAQKKASEQGVGQYFDFTPHL